MIQKRKQFIVLLVLTVLTASLFRFVFIADLPAGLYPDEAANGLDVNLILDGQRQPFYERGNGREALFFYLLVPAVKTFGRTPLAHHLTSAIVAVLTILFTFLLVRSWFGTRPAAISAFLAAVSPWYVVLSRTAFRAITAPLLGVLFFYFATRTLKAKTKKDYWISALFTGVFLSLGAYTYISFRMMVPLLFILALLLLIIEIRRREKWLWFMNHRTALAATLIAAVVVFLPMGTFFAQNPEWIVGRGGQVSIFSEDLSQGDVLGTFLEVVKKTALAFFTEGDLNWRHNVSGAPFLSPLMEALFIAGLLYVSARSVKFNLRALWGRAETAVEYLPEFVLALWFMLMLFPEILTAEGIPHGLRLIGIIPPVFIITALGLEKIISIAERKFKADSGTFREVITTAVAIILVMELVIGYHLYFVVAANSPEYYEAFRGDLTVVSEYLNQRNNKARTYLVIDFFSEQTPQYLTSETGNPYHVIDPGSLWQGPAKVRIDRDENERFGLELFSGDQVIFTQSTIFDETAFQRFYPEADKIMERKNQWNQTIMSVYETNP